MMVRAIKSRNYTEEELRFAFDKLQADPELDKKLSFPDSRITAGDFERHVARLRKLKRNCDPAAKLNRFDVSRLIDEFPDLVSWENFGVCGYTAQEEPLYRFSNASLQDIPPTPAIHDTKPLIRSKDDATGLTKLGDVIDG